jgi:glucan 1,3-beta-glucosidase
MYECLTDFRETYWNIKGVNIGGLFVLEPWITPSLFYQFLNVNNKQIIGMDTYTFCEALGPLEGKRQLHQHYEMWFNETDIKKIVGMKITHLRIPIGDWMIFPYGPYIGCTDEAVLYLDKILQLCEKHQLKVLLDLHGVKDSQNGLDNSGRSSNVQFVVAPTNHGYKDALTFIHWSTLAGNWAGTFDVNNKSYETINYDNIKFTKETLYEIIDTYKHYPAVFGIEPMNEPWIYTPKVILKDFYYEIYKYVVQNAPHLAFIYHDSFRNDIWDDFLINCTNVAIDWHIYQAWNIERYGDQFLLEADNYELYINNLKSKGINTIVGEFSFATDNCAMWLNGFQDNLEGFPITDCKYAPCPFPYIDVKDMDRTYNIYSPFGTGLSSPRLGTCPYEGTLIIDDPFSIFMNKLAVKKINGFSTSQGWFFWNFKTEFQDEIAWNFYEAYSNNLFQGTSIDPIFNSLYTYMLLIMFGIIASVLYIICSIKNLKTYHYVEVEISEKQPLSFKTKLKKHVSFGDTPYKYKAIDITSDESHNINNDSKSSVDDTWSEVP